MSWYTCRYIFYAPVGGLSEGFLLLLVSTSAVPSWVKRQKATKLSPGTTRDSKVEKQACIDGPTVPEKNARTL